MRLYDAAGHTGAYAQSAVFSSVLQVHRFEALNTAALLKGTFAPGVFNYKRFTDSGDAAPEVSHVV